MRNHRRTALMMVPLLLVGLSGGIAWSQQGEGRRGDGDRIARAERGEERGRRHWRGREGRRGQEGRRGRRGRGDLVKRMTEKLELSDEQVNKIKSALTDARKTRIGLRADARVAGIELREMVSQETVDKAKDRRQGRRDRQDPGRPVAGTHRCRAGGTGGADTRTDRQGGQHAETHVEGPPGSRSPLGAHEDQPWVGGSLPGCPHFFASVATSTLVPPAADRVLDKPFPDHV